MAKTDKLDKHLEECLFEVLFERSPKILYTDTCLRVLYYNCIPRQVLNNGLNELKILLDKTNYSCIFFEAIKDSDDVQLEIVIGEKKDIDDYTEIIWTRLC